MCIRDRRKRLVPVKLHNYQLLDVGPEKKYPEIHIDDMVKKDAAGRTLASNPFANKMPEGSKRKQRPAGSLIANEGQYGVALLRIEHFPAAFSSDESAGFYITTTKGSNVKVIPQKPFWFADWKQNNGHLK